MLSSVVFLIGVELVDAKGMRKIFAERPVEFWVALITALVVIFIGVEQGILLAIVLSIIIHTAHGYKPKNTLLSTDSSGRLHSVPVSSHTQIVPGLMIYRFQHSMYYANAELFTQEVSDLVRSAQPSLSWFCIDMTAVDDVDFSAAATLRETYKLLKEQGVRLVLSQVDEGVRRELDLSNVTALVGKDAYFETLGDVHDAFSAMTPEEKP